jgi:hypothetical protein
VQVNRTLLVLNLAGNLIGDEGCSRLAGALGWHPLDGQLLAARKRLMKELWMEEDNIRLTQARLPSLSEKQTVRVRPKARGKGAAKTKFLPQSAPGSPQAERSSIFLNRTSTVGKININKATVKTKAMQASTFTQAFFEGHKNKPIKEMFRPFRPRRFTASSIKVPAREGKTPVACSLLSEGYMAAGQVWLQGNRSLIALNLLHNKIGHSGLHAMALALEEQQEEWLYRQECREILQLRRQQDMEIKQKAGTRITFHHGSGTTLAGKTSSRSNIGERRRSQDKDMPQSTGSKTDASKTDGSNSGVEDATFFLEASALETLPGDIQRMGLLRLILHMNCFDAATAPDMLRINEILQVRVTMRRQEDPSISFNDAIFTREAG